MRGYRGALRQFARTGSLRALALQLRTGAVHWLRQLLRIRSGNSVELFLRNYGSDGVGAGDSARAALQLDAQACLVCGLCSGECARVGGDPVLDPRDAVLAAARLEVEVLRLGLSTAAGPCSACAACAAVCPVRIPIHRVQDALASLAQPAA